MTGQTLRSLIKDTLPFCLLPLAFCLASPAHALTVSGSILSGSVISYEMGSVSTGTLVSFTADTAGSVELDVFDAVTSSQIAAVPQNVPGALSGQIFWNGLWLLGNQFGRKDGNYILQLNLLTTGGSAVPFTFPTPVQINSVDIHNLTATPINFDVNGQPTFPYVIQYLLAKAAYVTATVSDSSGTVVRTLLANKLQADETVSTGTLVWNGLNDAGQAVPLGIYTSTITATDAAISGSQAIPRAVTIPVVSSLGAAIDPQKTFEQSAYVYPNPVRGGSATFKYQAVRDNATITLKIYTIDGTLVRSETFGGLPAGTVGTFAWDAANQSGRKVGRGLYFYVLKETDSSGTLQTVKKMAVIP